MNIFIWFLSVQLTWLDVDEKVQAPVAPMTPNLQLRRKVNARSQSGQGSLEPPPSPTHQPTHRRLHGHELDAHGTEEMQLRVEWNSVDGQAERIVLSPAVRWRSMSTGHLDKDRKASRRQRHPGRRKSRSLDSSPVPYDRPRTGVRRYFASTHAKAQTPTNHTKVTVKNWSEKRRKLLWNCSETALKIVRSRVVSLEAQTCTNETKFTVQTTLKKLLWNYYAKG